jgi:hypothetical protein
LSKRNNGEKMDIKKERFRKMFPNLAREIESAECETTINSVRSDPNTGEHAVAKRFTGYTPDVIDFLRRCDKREEAEEIISYLKKQREISPEYATKLRKQLKKNGIRSFGSKKEDDYYLKQDGFQYRKKKRGKN